MYRQVNPAFWPVALLVLAFFLASCQAAEVRPPQPLAPVKVTAEDQGRTFKAVVGQTVTINLEGNPSTGYDWHFTSLDETMLELITRTADPLFPGRTGSPARMLIHLKALRAGTATVKMAYFRAWEGPQKAENFFEFTVQID